MQNNTFSTAFIGQNIIKLISVDSTNDYLKKLTSNSEPLLEGTVIMAEHQYAGRGQRQSSWQAEAGKNLTFSVILTPKRITPENSFRLNIMVSVALNQALSKYVYSKLTIKWPNDIYFGNQKLGGILIENAILGNNIKHTIIGIGINVNQLSFNYTLAGSAISLAQILHQQIDLPTLLHEICIELESVYLSMEQGKHLLATKHYVDKLYQFGTLAKYSHNGEIFEGTIQGITDNGMLIIKPPNGQIITFGFKEVSFL